MRNGTMITPRHRTGALMSAMALSVVVAAVALSACTNSGDDIEAEGAASAKASAPSNGQITDTVTQGVRRDAAQDGQWPLTKTCPSQENSYDLEFFVTNWLPQPITLQAGNLDCYDWSGDKTPATVLNGQQLNSGQTRQFTLRVRGNTDRNWSMKFTSAAGSTGAEFRSDEFRVQNPTNTATTFIASGNGSFACGSQPLGNYQGFTPQPEPGRVTSGPFPLQIWSNGSQVMGTVGCTKR